MRANYHFKKKFYFCVCVCVCVKFYLRWLTHQSEQIKQLVNGLNNQMIIISLKTDLMVNS